MLCYGLMEMFSLDVDWDKVIGKCSCAHWVYGKHVPEEYWELVDVFNRLIVDKIRSIDSTIRYIMIEYSTGIQGGQTHIPSIEVHLDRKWFGYDATRANEGPHWGRFHARGTLVITLDRKNIQGYQNSAPDAKPYPRFKDFFPDIETWRKPDTFEHTRGYEKYYFFPNGETGYRR